MREIRAYVHRDRVADVIAALKESNAWGGEGGDAKHGLAVYLVQGMVSAPSAQERYYSTDLGDEVIREYKLELLCEDDEVQALVDVISQSARMGAPGGSWITVSSLERAIRIR